LDFSIQKTNGQLENKSSCKFTLYIRILYWVTVVFILEKGVYVLTDNDFMWIKQLSSNNPDKTLQGQTLFLKFPCGLIKGALENLGLLCSVSAEITTNHTVLFHIKSLNKGE
jgi:hypothetical protein